MARLSELAALDNSIKGLKNVSSSGMFMKDIVIGN